MIVDKVTKGLYNGKLPLFHRECLLFKSPKTWLASLF